MRDRHTRKRSYERPYLIPPYNTDVQCSVIYTEHHCSETLCFHLLPATNRETTGDRLQGPDAAPEWYVITDANSDANTKVGHQEIMERGTRRELAGGASSARQYQPRCH